MMFKLGEGLEECLICGKKHPKAFMNIHMRKRHMDKVKFNCTQCKRSFNKQELLTAHMKKHSGRFFLLVVYVRASVHNGWFLLLI